MFKDTLQPDVLFQIQLCKLSSLCSQLFIAVPSLEIIAPHSEAQKEIWGIALNLLPLVSWISSDNMWLHASS